MAYRCTAISSLPWVVLVMSMIGLTFIPRCSVLKMITLQTVPTDPSLRHLITSGSLTMCQLVQVYYHQPSFPHHDTQQDANDNDHSFSRCGQNFWEWPVLLDLWLLLCVQSHLSFQRGLNSPQCPDAHFSNPEGTPSYSLCNLQP
jgi:hypothetical protein